MSRVTVIETRYAGTGGVLIGTGARWLLLAAEPSPADVEALWSVLTRAGPAVDAIVGMLEEQHPLGLPSLALIDLSSGEVQSACRGSGRIAVDGDARVLYPGQRGRPARAPARGRGRGGRLRSGGSASPCPRPREAARSSTPSRSTSSPRPRRSASTTPADGRGRWTPRRAGRTPRIRSAPPRRRTPTIRGSACLRAGAAARRDDDPDHDGHTTVRPADDPAVPPDERHATSETVLAVRCPAGHLTATYAPDCRVCHRPVAAQDPRRVPRPRLGVLTLPTGEVVPLDRGVAFGRKPRAVPGGEPYPHLVHLPAESTYLSRLHLQVELDGWLVLARDLGSQGGTRLHVPGREPEQLRPHEAYVLEHGHTLDLADVYPVTFEVVS